MMSYIKTARKHIRRSPYQALAAVLIMTLTFFVATILAILAYASHSTLRHFETQPQIIAFLKNEATSEQVSVLQKELDTDSRVRNVRYVSKEDALEIYRKATSDKPVLSELVSPKVFPASLEFSVTDLSFAEEVIREVEQKETVNQVAYTASLGSTKNIGEVVNNLRNITNYIRIGGLVLLGFLLTSSLLILLVILGMRISSRREEIEILQLIGATPGFIRAPFIFEGIFYALSGAFAGWLAATLGILYLTPSIASFFADIEVLPLTTQGLAMLLGAILGSELLLGLILGATGSFIALRRYLKI
ncbi:MAG: hypothetical protein A3F61_02735 [Candidatus Blackburnbacteria bacterium RIFCSPHIGHO2_12_FULL_41_13b]|uniref:Cell division protein FtsX n=1 Tax=Candidatus Blackburnbacteria bacterium RIFCSPHIGHO2_12_FULL_41_13b TaxID=1797517 RepID=A0A1G1V9P1_9BACT|nr:MAG: hypothetical protein A3F61_02735 [Candidatus Blackburnbacteria bacterium RIFCSPHIGHO2_12_FULL_41_13b]